MPVPQQRKPKSGWHAPGTPCTVTKLFLTVSNASHWVFDSSPVPLTSSSGVTPAGERQIILERIIKMWLVQGVIISHLLHVKKWEESWSQMNQVYRTLMDTSVWRQKGDCEDMLQKGEKRSTNRTLSLGNGSIFISFGVAMHFSVDIEVNQISKLLEVFLLIVAPQARWFSQPVPLQDRSDRTLSMPLNG